MAINCYSVADTEHIRVSDHQIVLIYVACLVIVSLDQYCVYTLSYMVFCTFRYVIVVYCGGAKQVNIKNRADND